jgi:hypothetical protein
MSLNTTTTPLRTQGWTPEPNNRGTTSLLWTCLFTVFVCTWTVQHPDIGTASTSWRKKAKGTVWALLAPEAFTVDAVREGMEAWMLMRRVREKGVDGAGTWTLEHAFFCCMGGWGVEGVDGGDDEFTEGREMLKPEGLLWMVQNGYMALPSDRMSKAQLLDRSKQDRFAKVVAVFQSTWLVVQCIARRAQGSPITTLELSATAFVLCTGVTWAGWWRKPKDVEFAVMVPVEKIPEGLREVNTYIVDEDTDFLVIALGNSIMGAFFGAIHCLAFNFHFPTELESVLWRVAAVTSMATTPVGALFAFMYRRYYGGRRHWMDLFPVRLMVGIYFVARCYLVVEAFVGLRAVPEGVYRGVEWMEYLPKVG